MQVSLLGLRRGDLSDARGEVRIERIPAGQRLVELRRIGYATEQIAIDFEPGAKVEGEVAMLLQPISLDRVEVTAANPRPDRWLDMSGFYDREKMGFGRFLSGERLRERIESSLHVSDVFRGIPGIRLVPDSRGSGHVLVSSRGASAISSGACVMPVFVDGIRVALNSDMGYSLDTVLHSESIAGIEVYPGPATTPMQFLDVRGGCGAIVIWTGMGS